MEKKTVAFSKESTNLFFHILTKCNLSCIHCYINPEQHGTATLDITTIKNWMGLFSKKAPQTNIIFLGGEPTLHPDLHLAVKSARQMRFKSITIDTNGYLFHDILNKISCDDVDFISFSLDGATQKTNDALRGVGSYDTVMKGIKQARDKGFSCSMIYTVSDKNIHEIKHMPELINTLGIKRFFIQVIGMRGKSSKDILQSNLSSPPNQVTKDIWLSTIPEVANKTASQGVIVTYPKVFLNTAESFQCAGNVAENYFIFPNGRVYQCPICEDFPFNSYEIINNKLQPTSKINEKDFFQLNIAEGCVMNKMIQPENLSYDTNNHPEYQIACCLLKEEIHP